MFASEERRYKLLVINLTVLSDITGGYMQREGGHSYMQECGCAGSRELSLVQEEGCAGRRNTHLCRSVDVQGGGTLTCAGVGMCREVGQSHVQKCGCAGRGDTHLCRSGGVQ